MENLNLKKNKLKASVAAFDKVFVLHFLHTIINLAPVGVFYIFESQCVIGSVKIIFNLSVKFAGKSNRIINYFRFFTSLKALFASS